MRICLENLKQEELLTQKCQQDLNLSEELQKTCSAKLNDSESRINESQLPIGYEIAFGISSAIVIALEVVILVAILAICIR